MGFKKKELNYFTGVFVNMTETSVLVRPGKEDVKSATITITKDDGQKAFFECRDQYIDKVAMLQLRPGEKVSIGYVLIGMEKNERKYNNLFVNSIELV